MPVTVFLVGVMMGTEAYSHSYALNMLVVAVGTGIASHGELNFSVLGVMYQVCAGGCLARWGFVQPGTQWQHVVACIRCVLGFVWPGGGCVTKWGRTRPGGGCLTRWGTLHQVRGASDQELSAGRGWHSWPQGGRLQGVQQCRPWPGRQVWQACVRKSSGSNRHKQTGQKTAVFQTEPEGLHSSGACPKPVGATTCVVPVLRAAPSDVLLSLWAPSLAHRVAPSSRRASAWSSSRSCCRAGASSSTRECQQGCPAWPSRMPAT
jgi:hypothetical protein